MDPVRRLVSRAAPLDRSDVDTDQIIPAIWLKRVERTGYENGLFQLWRKDPDFVLNQPEYQGAQILVAGPNFGCGSSREHAPWALRDYGFRAIISSRFADIFRNNLPNNGLVPVQVDQTTVDRVMQAATADPTVEVIIDVESRTVSCPAAGVDAVAFSLDDSAHYRLVNGYDEIDLTLELAATIDEYESRHRSWIG